MQLSVKLALFLSLVTTSALAAVVARDDESDKVTCSTYVFDPTDVWDNKIELLSEDEASGARRRSMIDDDHPNFREADKIIQGPHYYWSATIDDFKKLVLASRGFGQTQEEMIIPGKQWKFEVIFTNGAPAATYWLSSDVSCHRFTGYETNDVKAIFVYMRQPSQ